MRHRIYGYQLKRTSQERRRLFRGLIGEMFSHHQVTTTRAKAKAVQPELERLMTKLKDHMSVATALSEYHLDKDVVQHVKDSLIPAYTTRSGGYTRIIRLGRRPGDDADMVLFGWSFPVTQVETARTSKKTTTPKTKNSNEKKSVELKKDNKEKKSKAKI